MRLRRATSAVRGLPTLLVATAAFRASQNMGLSTLSLLGRSRGVPGAAIGAIAAVASLVGVATMMLISARLPPERARSASAVSCASLAVALVLFLPRPVALLVLASVVLGAAGGLGQPSLATAVAHEVQARAEPTGSSGAGSERRTRARALALFSVTLSASLALGPALEAAILSASHEDLRLPYVVFAVVALVGVLTAHRFGRPMVSAVRRPVGLGGIRSLLANRTWALAVAAELLYSVPFAVVVVFGGLIAKSTYHVASSEAQAALAVFFATSFCVRVTVAFHPPVHRRARVFAGAVVATIAGLLVVATGSGSGALFLGLALLGLPHGVIYPVALALVAESVPSHELPHANANFTALAGLSNTVAPVILGAVVSGLGDRAMVLSTLIPVVVLALMLWRLRDTRGSRADEIERVATGANASIGGD